MTEEEKVIKEIIERYGEEINMKKTPYIIVEIIRNFGGRLVGGGCGLRATRWSSFRPGVALLNRGKRAFLMNRAAEVAVSRRAD
jgi:hypothetical protein